MEFTDILKNYNIPYKTEGHHHCRTGFVQFDCPFCGQGSNNYHMGYSLLHKFCNCWRCGHHTVFSVLEELTGLPAKQIGKLIKGLPSTQTTKQKITGKLVLPENLVDVMKPHRKYLKKRGFDVEELKKLWQIQGIGVSANLSWRIFIPIHFNNELVSWTTRSISSHCKRRYLGASAKQESMSKNDILYGEQYCRHAVVICEGPFDVWKIGPGAVAIMGLHTSPKQIERMLRHPVRAVCFDNQPEAQVRAQKLTDTLSLYAGETYLIQLDSKDAGCAKPREIKNIRKLLK